MSDHDIGIRLLRPPPPPRLSSSALPMTSLGSGYGNYAKRIGNDERQRRRQRRRRRAPQQQQQDEPAGQQQQSATAATAVPVQRSSRSRPRRQQSSTGAEIVQTFEHHGPPNPSDNGAKARDAPTETDAANARPTILFSFYSVPLCCCAQVGDMGGQGGTGRGGAEAAASRRPQPLTAASRRRVAIIGNPTPTPTPPGPGPPPGVDARYWRRAKITAYGKSMRRLGKIAMGCGWRRRRSAPDDRPSSSAPPAHVPAASACMH